MNLRNFAYELLAQQDELEYLRKEVERLKDIEREYYELISNNFKSSQEMMGTMLRVAMNIK